MNDARTNDAQAGQAPNGDRELVYGHLPETLLVILPRHEAERLALLQRALEGATTWGDFWTAIDDEERAWLQEAYEEEEEPLPAPESPMDPDAIPGHADGDWPAFPDQIMLTTLPDEVVERFGERFENMLSGSHISFDLQDEEAILEALREHGYRCTRDDALVRKASRF